MTHTRLPNTRGSKFAPIHIQLLMNDQDVASLSMPGTDPRFADEDTMVPKILAYVELRQEHSRRMEDNSVPEWNSFVASYGMAEYRYTKPNA